MVVPLDADIPQSDAAVPEGLPYGFLGREARREVGPGLFLRFAIADLLGRENPGDKKRRAPGDGPYPVDLDDVEAQAGSSRRLPLLTPP